MGWMPLERRDLLAQPLEVLALIQQARTQQDVVFHRAGYALAEPQSSGVILLGVIHRLERLRPYALHVPQMKKFMCRHIGQ